MNILTINLALSTLVFWIAAKLYVLPKLQDYEARTILLPILLLHSLRHLGLMFLASGATYPGIPPQFTHPAAYGDLITAVLAMIAIPAVATRARSAKLLVWFFNIVGSLDLIDAITLATVYEAAPFYGPRILDSGVLGSRAVGNSLSHVSCPSSRPLACVAGRTQQFRNATQR